MSKKRNKFGGVFGSGGEVTTPNLVSSKGGTSRFFYCAKAAKKERTCNGQVENKHPTVKPLKLMEYLLTLVSNPVENYILDPFCGSGSTLVACKKLGFRALGIDEDVESVRTSMRRLINTPPLKTGDKLNQRSE